MRIGKAGISHYNFHVASKFLSRRFPFMPCPTKFVKNGLGRKVLLHGNYLLTGDTLLQPPLPPWTQYGLIYNASTKRMRNFKCKHMGELWKSTWTTVKKRMLDFKQMPRKSIISSISDIYQQSLGNSIAKLVLFLEKIL